MIAFPHPSLSLLLQRKLGYDPDGSGYHFKRHDFEPEWDNDAETVVADMEFTELDTEEDRRHKLRTFAIYNERLDERERRRNFLLSRNLIKVKQYQVGGESVGESENGQARVIKAKQPLLSSLPLRRFEGS